MGELAAASRVYDERPAARGALDPAPSSRGRSVPKRVLDNADDFIEGPRFVPYWQEKAADLRNRSALHLFENLKLPKEFHRMKTVTVFGSSLPE